MVKRMLRALTALLLGGVAACDDAPQSVVTYLRPGGTWAFFDYATRSGPLLVQAVNAPPGGDAASLSAQAAQAVAGAISRKVFSTTPNPAEAPAPDYRLLLAFDLPASTSPDRLCDGSTLPAATPGLKLTVLAAFCHRSQVEAAAIGSIPRPTHLPSPDLADLIGQIARQIIVEEKG